MSDMLPYMLAYGPLPTILNKIKEAQTPSKFTHDFLHSKLGFKSSSSRAVIPLLKRLSFLTGDNTPTELYKRFRGNPAESRRAMADGIRAGYKELFSRNEYAHGLARAELEGLVIQTTGLEKGNQYVRSIVATFEALKPFADFESKGDESSEGESARTREEEKEQEGSERQRTRFSKDVGLNLSYTINLNLPETTNIDVFNAIFRSLRENLLK